MKNFSNARFVRLFGIIAMIAVIGLVLSCGDEETSPEDQSIITITDLPAGANGNYAIMGLKETAAGEIVAIGLPKRINNNTVTCEMQDGTEVWGKDGSYFVIIQIFADEAMTGTPIYSGTTSTVKSVTKKENSFSSSIFQPDINGNSIVWGSPVVATQPTAAEYGTYKYTNSAGVVETIVLTSTSFRISDTTGAGTDYLQFRIDTWDAATPISGYANAFKFTGKITGQQGFISTTSKTAPGFNATTDINGPDCWMLIYFNDGSPITLVRTALSKAGNDNTATIIKGDNNTTNRIYNHQ